MEQVSFFRVSTVASCRFVLILVSLASLSALASPPCLREATSTRVCAWAPPGFKNMDATEKRLAKRWLLEDGMQQTEARLARDGNHGDTIEFAHRAK